MGIITIGTSIKERLESGFQNWNGGYEQWLEWCDILYEPDAHYNVYGQRLTLQQYKDSMRNLFSAFDMQLGKFLNMLIEGDWCAIRYDVTVTNKQSGEKITLQSMEFVNFKNNPDPIGARVVEGWALADKPITDKPL